MKLTLERLNGNFWLRGVLIPILLTVPILWFTIPTVGLGTDNLRMIRHFDAEEANLVEFAGRTYSQGLIPVEYSISYPQLYYYAAGVILYPFTFLKGVNHRAIVIILRSLNILTGLLTAIFLYLFCLRFFKSIWIGILSSLLLTTSPDYMGWLIHSRPHIVEIFFLLAAFYFCFRIVEQYSFGSLAGATIFIGLATATRLGGLFMIPVAWAVCLYSMLRLQALQLLDYLKAKVKLIFFISSVIMGISVIIPLAAIFLFATMQEKLYLYGIRSLAEFLHSRVFRLMLIMVCVSFIGAFFWFIINLFSNKIFKNKHLAEKYRYVLALNKSILFLFYVFLNTILIFILFNPTLLLFPLASAKVMIFRFGISTLSSSFNPRLYKSIFDSTALYWFKLFFDSRILNGWFALLFFIYFIFEILNLKKNWARTRNFVFQRGLLWLYSLALFLVLFIFITHRPHHYLLPICMAMGMLLSFGAVEAVRKSNPKFFKYFLILLFGFIFISGFYARTEELIALYKAKIAKKTDTGIAIGEWLEGRFGENTKIWEDSGEFYIPPKFKNVSFMRYNADIQKEFANIERFSPDILVITSACDSSMANAKKVNLAIGAGRLKAFKQIKAFKYSPSVFAKPEYSTYREIYIYAKADI